MTALASGMSGSNYLVDYYVEADDAYREFKRAMDADDGGEALLALQRSARALCEGLQRLSNDSGFWAELGAVLERGDEVANVLRQMVDDLDDFLALEEDIFREQNNIPRRAMLTLLSDTSASLSRFKTAPNPPQLGKVREKIVKTAAGICTLTDALGKPQNRRNRIFVAKRLIGNALKAIGSAAQIVINGTAFVTIPVVAPATWFSLITACGTIMTIEIADADLAEIRRWRG